MLADNTRFELLKLLLGTRDNPYNVGQLTKDLGVTQPTTSHHLKALSEIGMVAREKRGRETFYRFNENYSCKDCGVFSAPIKS